MRETIIRTAGLTKRYGENKAVDGLELEIEKGEVFGLLGPNGAGKTTTILMLMGLSEPSAGKAEIGGYDCTREAIAVKRIVGYLPDNVGFYGEMTGRENLRFVGELNALTKEETDKRIEALLARVGMTDAADQRAGTYSRGMRQRLGIAAVLMKDPQVVILDEPTLGIDPEGVHELIGLIRELAEQDGRTVLVSSHQLYQVQQICDRVGIFVKGRLVAAGTVEELGKRLEAREWTLELGAQPDGAGLKKLLGELDGVKRLERKGDGWTVYSERDIRRALLDALAHGGYDLMYLRPCGGDLDEIYRRYFAQEEAV